MFTLEDLLMDLSANDTHFSWWNCLGSLAYVKNGPLCKVTSRAHAHAHTHTHTHIYIYIISWFQSFHYLALQNLNVGRALGFSLGPLRLDLNAKGLGWGFWEVSKSQGIGKIKEENETKKPKDRSYLSNRERKIKSYFWYIKLGLCTC